jgi:hypothetical protein
VRTGRPRQKSRTSFIDYRDVMPFSRYLDVLAEAERGINLPPSHLRATFLFAFARNENSRASFDSPLT